MPNPYVSVIVPVYNGEKYLSETVKSIINQTLKNIEIIFVNDGSTDSSLEILNAFQKNDSRIKIITQPNTNAGKARNTGLDIAIGEYLSILDADDLFAGKMLEDMYEEAKKHDADIVVCDCVTFDTETKLPIDFWLSLKTKNMNVDDVFSANDYPEDIFEFSCNVCWNKLFKHSFIKAQAIRCHEIKMHNDTFFSMAALASAEKIKIINKRLVYYRRGQNTQMSSLRKYARQKSYLLLTFEYLGTYLKKMGCPEQVRLSFASFALKCLYNELISFSFEHYEYHCHTIIDFWKNELRQAALKNMPNHIYINLHEMKNPAFIREYFKAPYKAMPYEYIIPEEFNKHPKVVLYGNGEAGLDYFLQLTLDFKAESIHWVDSQSEKLSLLGYPIKAPECVPDLDFDIILISVLRPGTAAEIREFLTNIGVSPAKIHWPIQLEYTKLSANPQKI